MKQPFLATLLALPLAACFGGAKVPDVLLSLTPAAAVPVGQTATPAAGTITIAVPAVPQALATARVPVQVSDTTVQYLKDAQWVEPPQRLFARVLADTITARTGRVVLATSQSFADPGARMSGELRDFGVDASTSEAVVTFDAALTRADGTKLEKRRFTARVPLPQVEAQAVGVALNQGANTVAGEVADWVGR